MRHLERAFDNQNQWWKYLVIFLVSYLAANFIGGIPLFLVVIYQILKSGGEIAANPENFMDLTAFGIHPNVGLILIILPFIVGLLAIALLVKPLHKRTIIEIINGTKKIRWKRIFNAMLVWMIIMAIFLFIDFFTNRDNFQVNLNFSSFIPLIFISIMLIPLQATYEEVLFRGYFTQGVAAWTKSKLWTIFIPAVIFGLFHSLNPEIKAFGFWLVMPQYMIFGLLFGILTVLDDGIECAIGAHAGNNVFGSIFITHKASSLQTPALLEQLEVNPAKELWSLIIFSLIFLFVLKSKYKWKFSELTGKIQIPSPESSEQPPLQS